MNSMWTVVGFTLRNKFRSKAFVVTTLIIAIILSLAVNVPNIIQQFDKDEPTRIGIVDDGAETTELLKAELSESEDFVLVTVADQGSTEANELALREQIKDGEVKGYLLAGEADEYGFPTFVYGSEETLDFGTSSGLQIALQKVKTGILVKELNLSDEEYERLNAPVTVEKVQVSVTRGVDESEGKSETEIVTATGMVYVLIILLFVAIMVSGQMIATEITTEKSSRVMEILVTSVSPLRQMFGKIIGMFIVGLSQIALLVAVAVFNLTMPQNREAFESMNIDLSAIDPWLAFYAILFYLTGYFLYATMFAAVGSIVSRSEDLGQAIMPITFISMAGYLIGIFGLSNPTSPIIVAASFIPFFAPFIMFLRMGTTEPALWEVWVSIGILFVTILFMGWLSAKIYRTGVLLYGKRPSWKELRKAMKAFKV